MKLLTAASILVASSLVISASAEAARKHHGKGRDLTTSDTARAAVAAPSAKTGRNLQVRAQTMNVGGRPRGVTVYLNRHGATLTAGNDDSAHDVSGMLQAGMSLDVPAWQGGDRAWSQVVGCVKDQYRDFNVDIVTERPTSGAYIMAMVGGQSSMLGYSDSVSGVALSDGGVNRTGIVFAFAETVESEPTATCLTVAHEVGHALGLDHEYLCADPMSYLWNCDSKRFQDVEAPCGEESPRTCENGEATQNSYRILAAAVGLRDDAGALPAEPAPQPTEEPSTDDQDDDGGTVDPYAYDDDDSATDDATDDDSPDGNDRQVIDLTAATAEQLEDLAHEVGFPTFASMMAWLDAHPDEVDFELRVDARQLRGQQPTQQTTGDDAPDDDRCWHRRGGNHRRGR